MATFAAIFLSALGIYLLIGVVFSLLFLWRGILKVDEGVKGSGFVFKLLIFPGLISFWPVFLRKWLKA